MVRASPDGRRALVRDQRGWRLLDADSGSVIAEIAPFEAWPGERRRQLPAFLADGRILTRLRADAGLALGVLDRDGTPIKELRLPLSGHVFLASQPSLQRIWLVQTGAAASDARLVEVDLDDGSLVERGRGLFPAAGYGSGLDVPPIGDGARWLLDATERVRNLRPDGTIVDPLAE